jgi:hypothetical protein
MEITGFVKVSAKEQVWDMFKTKKDSTKSADSQKTSSISCVLKRTNLFLYTLHFDTLEREHNPFCCVTSLFRLQ